MSTEDYREKSRSHLEDAIQAEDLETKNHHIREALQLLAIKTQIASANQGRESA